MSYLQSLDPILMHPYYRVAGPTLIGRDLVTMDEKDASAFKVVLARDFVSRAHCRLVPNGSAIEIQNFSKGNGTFVNGGRVERAILRDQDRIGLGTEGETHFIFMESKPPASRWVRLSRKPVFTIGRTLDNDIPLPMCPTVSSRHARLWVRNHSKLILEDLGSAGGTYLNGEAISRNEITPEDEISIGSVDLSFSLDGGDLSVRIMDRQNRIRIESTHLSRKVDGRFLLRDINLVVEPGEYVGLLGPSGAGKSTLLKALCGVEPATSGSVKANGADLYKSYDRFRDTLGYVPQDDIIHAELTVERSLEYTARLRLPRDNTREQVRSLVDGVIETLGLAHVRANPISRLSGGQRKRVSIGNELLTRPSLMFLDEPTSGLDPATEEKLMKHFREMCGQGQTIVVTTHILYSLDLVDLVAFLSRGRLVYFGPVREVCGFFSSGSVAVDKPLRIFDILEPDGPDANEARERAAEEWAERYRVSGLFEEFVVRRGGLRRDHASSETTLAHAEAGGHRWAASDAATGIAAPPRPSPPPVADPSDAKIGGAPRKNAKSRGVVPAFRQLMILTARMFELRVGKFKSLIIPMLAPLVLALLTGSIPVDKPETATTPHVLGKQSIPLTFPLAITMAAIFLGTFTACSEIASEKSIYLRERAVNLRIPIYVASKIPYLVMITSLQCVLFVGCLCGLKGLLFTSRGEISGSVDVLGLALSACEVAWCSAFLGLFISSLDPSGGRNAMTYAITAVLPQMFLCGAMPPKFFAGMSEPYRWIASALPGRWGFESLLTPMYRNHVWMKSLIEGSGDGHMGFRFEAMLRDAGCMAGLAAVYFALTCAALKRRDPL